MDLGRLADHVQSSAQGAASLAREAFRGLDAMAAQDGYINSDGGGTTTSSSSSTTSGTGRGSGGGSSSSSSAAHHDSRRPNHQHVTRVRFSDHHAKEDEDEEEGRDSASSHSQQPRLNGSSSALSSSCAKRGTMLQSGSSSDRSAGRRNSQPAGLPATNGFARGDTDEDKEEALAGRPYRDDEEADEAASYTTSKKAKKKKNSKRFLDDLDERMSLPMKPMQIEQSGHVVSSSSASTSSSLGGGPNKWASWLPSTAVWKNPATASSSAPPPPPPSAPLWARSRPRASNRSDDPGHDVDQDGGEYRVTSSASMLGDDELAKLRAMMDGTESPPSAGAGTSTTTATPAGRHRPFDVWQRREAFVAITLILFMLVYYLTRDRVQVEDST
jgi:hypothetical protein